MRRISRATACALTAAGVAACGSGGATQTVTVSQPPPAATPPPAGATEPSPTPAGGAGGDALVEALGSVDGARARFVITELRRSGPTVLLNGRVEAAARGERSSLRVGTTFSDAIDQPLERGGAEPADVFDGVALIDPGGRRKYLVARDATGRCVCSNDLGSALARSGAPVELQATLTAPPPEVKQVDVFVPRFRTFRGVSIAE